MQGQLVSLCGSHWYKIKVLTELSSYLDSLRKSLRPVSSWLLVESGPLWLQNFSPHFLAFCWPGSAVSFYRWLPGHCMWTSPFSKSTMMCQILVVQIVCSTFIINQRKLSSFKRCVCLDWTHSLINSSQLTDNLNYIYKMPFSLEPNIIRHDIMFTGLGIKASNLVDHFRILSTTARNIIYALWKYLS